LKHYEQQYIEVTVFEKRRVT